MKKTNYLQSLAVLTALIFSACSDETVPPSTETINPATKFMAKNAGKSSALVVDPVTMEVYGTSTLHPKSDKCPVQGI